MSLKMSNFTELAEEFLVNEQIPEEVSGDLLELSTNPNNYYSIINMNDKSYNENYHTNQFVNLLSSKTFNLNKMPKNNYIKITQNYLIEKIILHNVPDSTYLLNINGSNTITFKKITSNENLNDYCADITNTHNKTISIYKTDTHTYIDNTQIDNLRITYNSDTRFNSNYVYYSLYGYPNNKFKKINTKYKYYLNTTSLYFSHPTYFINLLVKTTDNPGKIYFYIEGKMYANIKVSSNFYGIKRIQFDKINKSEFRNNEKVEIFLSDEIKSNTINMSSQNDITISHENIQIDSIEQFYYKTMTFPLMTNVFAC